MAAPVFLTTEALAERWKMSAHTLIQWRQQARGPVFTKIGGKVRYELAIVEAWERARAVQSPADYGSIERRREAAKPFRYSEVRALAENYRAITRLVPLRPIQTAEQEAAAEAARLVLMASGAQSADHPLAELLGLLEARIAVFQLR
ncbi:helix-turn-helix transcriptional regulator [Methylobacterium sp. 22177]|uniref:helix-turn-helix transcriptional regulator n=1 Tax=Methylobacterium sp. 22177 TaxID=3453885 RepID=UPI003F841D99